MTTTTTTTTSQSTMQAIVIQSFGNADQLEHCSDLPRPHDLGPHDVLVRVQAAGMNPVDCKRRDNFGNYSEPLPHHLSPMILGFDGAGSVAAVGTSVGSRFSVGDEVWWCGDINRQGSNAQYQIVDSRILSKKPRNLTMEQAAAVPLTLLTAYELLVESMGITLAEEKAEKKKKKKSILIVGGAGGMGSILTQLCKTVLGLGTVISTASRQESREWCLKMGADHVISHADDSNSFHEQILDIVKNDPSVVPSVGKDGTVDYVVTCVNPVTVLPKLPPLLKPLGHIGMVSSLEWKDPLPLSDFMPKRASFHWSFVFSRLMFNDHPERHGEILDRAAEWFDKSILKTYVTKVFEWGEIREAHRLQESGRAIGKLVVRVPE